MRYLLQVRHAIGQPLKYWVWSSGPVSDGEGAYASNRPLPPANQLKGGRIFFAGVPNLFRRVVRGRAFRRGATPSTMVAWPPTFTPRRLAGWGPGSSPGWTFHSTSRGPRSGPGKPAAGAPISASR